MPELRIDPITGQFVYVAEERAGRPTDYSSKQSPSIEMGQVASRRSTTCPFCVGHEAETPDATAAVLDDAGNWRVRVVSNKYPAVSFADPANLANQDLGSARPKPAIGAHEVIIESPDHVVDVTELGVGQLALVLTVYRDRLRHWAANKRLRHAVVFKNSGFGAWGVPRACA